MTFFKPNRRDILKLAAMAPAFAMPGTIARAQLGAPSGQNPAHFRFSVGQARLTILSDGYFTVPISGVGVNADPAEVQTFLEQHFLSPEIGYSHTNHLLIENGDAVVLVDVGSGHRFFDSAGRLMANMEAAGIDPGSITHVVITHAHPDHIWGIRDDFDEPLFPDARYFLGQAEHAYWMQEDLVNKVAPTEQQFVLGAVNSITAEGLEWTLVKDGDQIAPGVRIMETPGHTAGHLSVVLESEGKQLIALGDSMSHAHLSFQRPEWFNSMDHDGDLTVQTRKRLLDMCAADRIAVVGYHFPFPGVGHVARDGDAYRFVPALWQF